MKQLRQIRQCSQMLQLEKLPLHECQGYLDVLMITQQNLKDQIGDDRGCFIGQKYIIANNGLSTDHYFETGVAKIQKGIMCEETMNLFETRACQVLLKSNNDEEDVLEDSDSNDDDIDFIKAVKANERKRKREEMGKSQYINCDFIMGSAACVERLWSEADAIFTKRRN